MYEILDPKTIINTTSSMAYKSDEWGNHSTIHTSTAKIAATYFILYISR